MTTPTKQEIEAELTALIGKAEAAGFVITVYLRPMPTKLAMGAYTMVGDVRPITTGGKP